MKRWKIDVSDSRWGLPFSIYRLRRGFIYGFRWERVRGAFTLEEARDFYNEVKDLPEYLD